MVPGSANAVRVLRSPESLAEVVANPPASVSFVVDEGDGVGSQKTWMPNHEDEDSAVSKHAPDRCQRCCKVRDVHQPKLACGDVERRVIERGEDRASSRTYRSVSGPPCRTAISNMAAELSTPSTSGSHPRERPGHEALPQATSSTRRPRTSPSRPSVHSSAVWRPAPRLHQFVIPRGDVRPCRTVRLTHMPDSRTEIGPGHGLPTPPDQVDQPFASTSPSVARELPGQPNRPAASTALVPPWTT